MSRRNSKIRGRGILAETSRHYSNMIAVVDHNQAFGNSLQRAISPALPYLTEFRLMPSAEYPGEREIAGFLQSVSHSLDAVIINVHVTYLKNGSRYGDRGLELYERILRDWPTYQIIILSFDPLDRLRRRELGYLLQPEHSRLFTFHQLPICIVDIVGALRREVKNGSGKTKSFRGY